MFFGGELIFHYLFAQSKIQIIKKKKSILHLAALFILRPEEVCHLSLI